MKTYHRKLSALALTAGAQQLPTLINGAAQFAEFIIDKNSDRLEDSSCSVLVPVGS